MADLPDMAVRRPGAPRAAGAPLRLAAEHRLGCRQESLETFFQARFLEFLRTAFNNEPERIAYTFGVTGTAAENWISGASLPNGFRMWLLLAGHPDALHGLHVIAGGAAGEAPADTPAEDRAPVAALKRA